MNMPSAGVTATDKARDTGGIAIVLAGPEAASRSHLKQLLEHEHDMSVVAEASRLDSVRQHVLEHHPDVVVLGFNANRLPTLAALHMLFSETEDTRYVVMHLEQDAVQHELPEAIRMAASREPARSRSRR